MNGDVQPGREPVRAFGGHPPVNLHPDAPRHASQAGKFEQAERTIEQHQGESQPVALHPLVHKHLVRLNRYVIIILSIAALAIGYIFLSPIITKKPAIVPGGIAEPTPTSTPNPGAPTAKPNFVSCLSSTGPDATTQSQSFVDVDGTECTYKSGSTPETLILSGKLTGRNTEGTGMSASINVNGRECNGGESLNYSRTYTPMFSNCVFEVPANSSVLIKWRFLSPFGGTAAVLRSNKNIAPFISGVAIPKEGAGGASPSPSPKPRGKPSG